VFNATFNNIPVISLRSVLFAEEKFYVYSFSVKEFALTNLEGRHYNIYGLNITVDKIMVKFYQKLIHVNGYKITFDTKIGL
jgi:hypothetical protein